MTYTVFYNDKGHPKAVRDGNKFIPIDEKNVDFREFIEWNRQQEVPLDYSTPLPLSPREITISPSQQIILADDIDVAKITIRGEPGATIDYTVNNEPFQTILDASGQDTIELTCDTPNTTLLVQSETAKAVIYAVEVPA